jgi:hypothetical protein
MVLEEDKKRIDDWLEIHLKELSQPTDGSVARCPWAYSSKVPVIHTDQYMDIMKHMINFPYEDNLHGLLIVLHGVQDRNEGQDLIGLCKTQYFVDRDLLFIEYNYDHYKNELNDPTIRLFIIQKITETKKASEKLYQTDYYKTYPHNMIFRKIREAMGDKHFFEEPKGSKY